MNFLFLTILFPLLIFFMLSISQGGWSNTISSIIGVSGVALSAIITIYIIFDFNCVAGNKEINFVFFQEFGSWFKIDNLHIDLKLRLDRLSLIMLSVITSIGLIVHIYAIWYMIGNEGYSRFFAYTNLFISNMILLVLSDNLLLIYFGWEGVGLCSYLLIGFYYFNSKNGISALKAFIITRFGDICLICALFMIYDQYYTLNLSELLELKPQSILNNMSTWISIMLLIGSLGKSAQVPLQTWLVNAMVGPTPVSALIHSATMVAAGVYLINRMQIFFIVTPYVLYMIGIIGAITLITAACSASFQSNIKKILAYSTISQIGYMFLALGEKNWNAAMFHLTTHASFKALLFLAAGSLIYACHNEQNIFKMGGLCKSMPLIYICFLIGGMSLCGFPIITSGFYSKESILLYTFIKKDYIFLFLELIGIFLTSVYTFRMIFIIFHGKEVIQPKFNYQITHILPLIVLLLLSTFIGGRFLSPFRDIIVSDNNHDYDHNQMYLIITSTILIFFGIWIVYIFWINSRLYVKGSNGICFVSDRITRYLILLCHYGWGIDYLYKIIFVRTFLLIIKKLFYYGDPFKSGMNMFILLLNCLRNGLRCSENGKLNWYVASINIGAIIVLLIVFINFYV